MKPTCDVAGCDRAAEHRGWCNAHYERWRRTGSVQADKPLRAPGPKPRNPCIAPDCTRMAAPGAKLMCAKHYQRMHYNGTLVPQRVVHEGDTAERFWQKVREVPSGCWEWQAGTTVAGYGKIKHDDGRELLAHRFGYEQMVGEIPDGLVLDHLCRNPPCVNPWHLDPVTIKVNNQRAVHKRAA